MNRKFKYTAVSAALACVFYQQSLMAQTTDAPAADEEAIEKINVTGSRIKRFEFAMPMPLVSLSKDEIDDIGTNDITDALLEIPSVEIGVTAENSTTNVQNNGISSVDLRGLGDNRTLVLIDGRRTVSNSANGNRVSTSTIPSLFLDGTEVITGGASSIYGSDAVAGVVNLITEKEREGLEVDLRGGLSNTVSESDQTYNIGYGLKFDDDKGYIFGAISYDTETGIKAIENPRALIQADYRYDDGVNAYVNKLGDSIPIDQITPDEYGSLSSDPDGGRFDGSNFWYDDNGLREDFEADRDGYDFRREDTLSAPRDRTNYGLKGSYYFTDDTEGFFTLLHAVHKTRNVREPEGDDYNDIHLLVDPVTFEAQDFTAGRIPIDNPFAPSQIVEAESSRGIRWDRRFVEVGQQVTENTRKTTRAWAGLRGVVFDDWDWEASVGYGKFVQDQVRFGEINIVNLRKGLNAERLADGTIQCADATDRAEGCVPVNLFGRGSITPEAVDYIRADLGQHAEVTQFNVQAFMAGDLFELPAGPVGAAFGIEYRKDEQDLLPDALNQRGGHSSIHVPAFTGSIAVGEVFGELSFPLLSDVPGAHSLSVDTSVRIANYDIDQVGTVVSFGTGLQWQPIPDLNFRASFNRALRAPDLTELFSPPRGDSDSFTDICEGVTLTSVGVIDDNCRAEPGVLAFINNPDNDGEFEEDSGSHSSPNAGNLELKEEEADTYTIGLVWQPESIEGFSFAADYYNIEITDAIDSFDNRDILRQCYEDASTFRNGNPFCEDVFRNPEDGQLTNVIQRQFNLNSQETSGIDYMVNYEFDLDGIGLPGEFEMRYIHTHLIKYVEVVDGLDGIIVDDQKGEFFHDKFEDRSRLSLIWKHDDWRVSWRTTYYGSTFESQELRELYEEAIEEFGEAAEVPTFLNVESEMFHNLQIRYSTRIAGNRTRFYLGVNNVFDNEGPFFPGGDTETGNSSNYSDAFGIRGRYGYARVNVRF